MRETGFSEKNEGRVDWKKRRTKKKSKPLKGFIIVRVGPLAPLTCRGLPFQGTQQYFHRYVGVLNEVAGAGPA